MYQFYNGYKYMYFYFIIIIIIIYILFLLFVCSGWMAEQKFSAFTCCSPKTFPNNENAKSENYV